MEFGKGRVLCAVVAYMNGRDPNRHGSTKFEKFLLPVRAFCRRKSSEVVDSTAPGAGCWHRWLRNCRRGRKTHDEYQPVPLRVHVAPCDRGKEVQHRLVLHRDQPTCNTRKRETERTLEKVKKRNLDRFQVRAFFMEFEMDN